MENSKLRVLMSSPLLYKCGSDAAMALHKSNRLYTAEPKRIEDGSLGCVVGEKADVICQHDSVRHLVFNQKRLWKMFDIAIMNGGGNI